MQMRQIQYTGTLCYTRIFAWCLLTMSVVSLFFHFFVYEKYALNSFRLGLGLALAWVCLRFNYQTNSNDFKVGFSSLVVALCAASSKLTHHLARRLFSMFLLLVYQISTVPNETHLHWTYGIFYLKKNIFCFSWQQNQLTEKCYSNFVSFGLTWTFILILKWDAIQPKLLKVVL